MEWIYYFDLIGCAVFALSGALVAYEKRMDGVGVLVLAAVTAIGGGTVRDLLLDAPVFWLADPLYTYVILLASVFSVLWLNVFRFIPSKGLEIADALGLSLFVIMGTHKAMSFGVTDSTAIIMGMMTGCFGGMIRDVLANKIPMIFEREMYAMCCIVGSSVYVFLSAHSTFGASLLGFLVVFGLRLGAIRWKWQIHVFKY